MVTSLFSLTSAYDGLLPLADWPQTNPSETAIEPSFCHGGYPMLITQKTEGTLGTINPRLPDIHLAVLI